MARFEIIIKEWKDFIEDKLIPEIKKCSEPLEGNIYCKNLTTDFSYMQEYQKTQEYYDRFTSKQYNIYSSAKQSYVSDVLEIGFNSGFSTLLILLSNPNIKLICVDINYHKYTLLCYNVIKSCFPDRINLLIGDSTIIVPTIKEKFDLIHIDGCHEEVIAEKDILNTIPLAKINTIFIMDDTDIPHINKLWNHYTNLHEFQKCNYELRECIYHSIKINSNKKIEETPCYIAFQNVYKHEAWGKEGDGSGSGSEIDFTQNLRKILIKFMLDNNINEILDAPCGAGKWTKYLIEEAKNVIPNFKYQGVDVSEMALERARKNLGEDIVLSRIDITKDKLPPCNGLILCRDTLQHLSFSMINNAIKNLSRTEAQYIIIGGFVTGENKDLPLGHFFHFNITTPPYSFEPDLIIKENHPRSEMSKYLFVFSNKSLKQQLSERIKIYREPNMPNFWREYLQSFLEYDPSSFSSLINNSDKVMVIVETRCIDILEYVLKNFLFYLQKNGWNLMIFHGYENESYVKNIIKGWNNVILYNLEVYDFSLSDYDILLTSLNFWDKIPFENILMFQSDTLLLSDKIEEFIQYDYCDTPQDHKINNGLSFRKKSVMISCITKYLNKCGNKNESIFFSQNISNKPTIETTSKFSAGSIIYEKNKPFGLDKTYRYINHNIIIDWINSCNRKWEWEIYSANNEDLSKAGLLTPNSLLNHYKTFGIRERRMIYSDKPRILFISHCYSAGTFTFYKYFESCEEIKKQYIVFYYSTKNYLNLCDLSKISHIHINSIFNNGVCDIDIDFLINFVKKAKKKTYITIHDLQWLQESPNPDYNLIDSTIDINRVEKFIELISLVDLCIFPCKFLSDVYLNKLKNKDKLLEKIRISPHPDHEINLSNLYIPKIINNEINIAFLGHFVPRKGSNHFLKLTDIPSYDGIKLNYYIIGGSYNKNNIINLGPYNDENTLKILYENNISLIVYLVDCAETYGFCFSWGLLSGIPLLYHNIGAFTERTNVGFHERFFPIEYSNKDTDIILQYNKALKYIISNSGKNNIDPNKQVNFILPELYKEIYLTN